MRKPWKQLIEVHENSGFNHKEKTIRGRLLVVTAVKCCVVVQTENQNKTHLCAYSRIVYSNRSKIITVPRYDVEEACTQGLLITAEIPNN